MTLRRYLQRLLVVAALLSLVAACSDDTETGDEAQDCDPGLSYNPISGQCEPETTNNSTSNNSTTNNSTTNNSTTNNSTSNNSTSNNSTSNNSTTNNSTTNNSTTNNSTSNNSTSNNSTSNNSTSNNSTTNNQQCGPGDIIGKSCAPSGEVLAGATVTLDGFDCDGNAYPTRTTTTDANGEYTFDDVPSGQHTITVTSGSFNRQQQVYVQPGQTLDLSTGAAKVCFESGNVEIAVIEGSYDAVEEILDDLGLDYDVRGDDQTGGSILNPSPPPETHAFLMDLNAMREYDIIFINCGDLWDALQSSAPGDMSTIISNIKAFLDDGNSLYASDWAHPFIENVYPDAVDFYGNDSNVNEARIGYAPQTVQAEVSPDISNVLGHSSPTIEFPHDPYANPPIINTHWVVAEGVGANSTRHLWSDVDLCESHFSAGASCDRRASTQSDAPILVTHKAPSGGTAIFTSFHNKRQHDLNDDMEKIMRFLIFQL
jgi:hypothetical protein